MRGGFFKRLFGSSKDSDIDSLDLLNFNKEDEFDEDYDLDYEDDFDYNEVSSMESPVGRYVKKPKKSDIHSSVYKYALVVFILLISLSLVSFFFVFCIKNEIFSRGKVGAQAVKALYEFNTIEEIESNLPKLEKLTTDSIYSKIAVTNSDKALNVYLKFKKNPVKVEIITSKPGYVLYTLDSSSLSSGRLFMFTYTLNWKGEIDSVREMECIDFYKNQ